MNTFSSILVSVNNFIYSFILKFGHWAGQLGDGRAHLLGAYKNRSVVLSPSMLLGWIFKHCESTARACHQLNQ